MAELNQLKPGMLLYVRATSEPVAYIRPGDGREDAVLVRRPLETKNDGITHAVELWPLVELETYEEGLQRRFEDQKTAQIMRQKFDAQPIEEAPEVLQ